MPNSPGKVKLYLGDLNPGFGWTEMIASWEADTPPGSWIEVFAQADFGDRRSKPYSLGKWSLDDKLAPRWSVNDQKDEDGRVATDTLILGKTPGKVGFFAELNSSASGEWPSIRAVHAVFSSPTVPADESAPNSRVLGKVLDVPTRSQMTYPGGNVLCSPTAVSMVLWYWASFLGRPELDRDVPLVQAGVFDKNWGGTGNWPFNTAYASSLPGMRGYVSRFDAVGQLEAWIERGIPVITSVSLQLIKGAERKGDNDGHLVVLVGFSPEGDPVFNDPGRSVEVRQTYKRDAFKRAWATSGNTVYLIYPKLWNVPQVAGAQWDLR